MKISIEGDGTKAGTKLVVNGTEIPFSSVHFGADQYSRDVWFAYSTESKDSTNQIVTRTTYTFDPSMASMSKKQEKVSPEEVNFADFGKM